MDVILNRGHDTRRGSFACFNASAVARRETTLADDAALHFMAGCKFRIVVTKE